MCRLQAMRTGLGIAIMAAVSAAVATSLLSCGGPPSAFPINGPGQVGNEPPTLTITDPTANLTVSQGERFLIAWDDSDPDDNATISFQLLSTVGSLQVVLASGVSENDLVGPETLTVDTTLVPVGTYNIEGTIQDTTNPPVEVFAQQSGTAVAQRVVVTIVGPGEGPQTQPPIVAVIEPQFNLSVAQDDVVDIVIQPTTDPPNADAPYDRDSAATLFILLDLDQDPTNDNPRNPDPDEIILLQTPETIAPDVFDQRTFPILIDLATIPPRPNGEPYFIRATIQDGTNPAVSSYAPGTLNVVRLAEGTVDLFEIGRTKSGARFQGFNPGANLGSSIATATDFDADGVDDFVLLAQFGNPQNAGPVGEAYVVYGQPGVPATQGQPPRPGTRFGGTIPVNSVSDTVEGVIFQAPPVRTNQIPSPNARTDGITDVSFIRDITFDGRPELIFGLPHVHGAFDTMDFDPGDDDPFALGCYPDLLVNNFTSPDPALDVQWFAGGMVVIINSQNRDNDPDLDPRPTRLGTTAVSLELTGTWQEPRWFLDAQGTNVNGAIFTRADNATLSGGALGNDAEEPLRISGARIFGGGYDWWDASGLAQPPREDQFGRSVGFVGDLTSDGLDELIISAPTQERYLADLAENSTHFQSTLYRGSLVVIPGNNQNTFRDIQGDEGTSAQPTLDHFRHAPAGACTPPGARHFDVLVDTFDIFAEDIDDYLGDGGSAGDFNRDGLGDILCGGPLNNRSETVPDSGATYVIYGRTTFGSIDLGNTDDPILRWPMLRIRGAHRGDRIGWRQTSGRDVNGDRIDDIFVSSPFTDFGGVTRSTCAVDINDDGAINNADLGEAAFQSCLETAGAEVFSDDTCKAFDYDNDGDIDEDDRCVFCCLSADCEPAASCVLGQDANNCCADLVDNGFVGIIFGGVFINGDRDITQIATTQLPGTVFYGTDAGDRAGYAVSSAGDFNKDGFGDLLIAVPGETRVDSAGRDRLGVVYLVFGGTHLVNTSWNLANVGAEQLPGIVFLSPYVKGRPNEAPPLTVGLLGDINDDSFDDIGIGLPQADFIDPSFPQGPDAPGEDATIGRRRNVGDAFVVYGNNFGSNRLAP